MQNIPVGDGCLQKPVDLSPKQSHTLAAALCSLPKKCPLSARNVSGVKGDVGDMGDVGVETGKAVPLAQQGELSLSTWRKKGANKTSSVRARVPCKELLTQR